MEKITVTVFGGSGFVGRHLVRRLAAEGKVVRVAVRDIEAANYLRPMGDVGQIELIQANVSDHDSVLRAVSGAEAVVNLVGALTQSRQKSFNSVHAQGPERIAMAAAAAALPLAAAPAVAEVSFDRNAAPVEGESELGGGAILGALAIAAIITGIVIAAGDDDDNATVSV